MTVQSTGSSPFPRGVVTSDETKKHPESQLSRYNLGSKEPTELKNKVPLEVGGRIYMVWDGAAKDLKRYGKLIINGKLIYVLANEGACKDPNTKLTVTASSVAQAILAATGNDFAEMIHYMNLMQQYSDSLSYLETFKDYHIEFKCTFNQIEKVVHLEVGKDSFRITNELLGKIVEIEDFENPDLTSYVKVKTVTEGSRASLVHEQYDEIHTKVVHTAQYSKESQARKANYSTGFFDFSEEAKSFIK